MYNDKWDELNQTEAGRPEGGAQQEQTHPAQERQDQAGQPENQAYMQGSQSKDQAYAQGSQPKDQAYAQGSQPKDQAYAQAGQAWDYRQAQNQPAGRYPDGQAQAGQPGSYPGSAGGYPGGQTQNYQNSRPQGQQGGNPYPGQYPYRNQNQNAYYQGQQGNGGSCADGPQPSGNRRPPKKKKTMVRTAAMVTAAAFLFGGVSGVTMFGVNRAAEILLPGVSGEEQERIGQTETQTEANQAVASGAQNTAVGVVIEDVSPIVDAAMPSVVAITNTMLYKSDGWFGPTQTIEVPSSGSGIIVGQNDTELLIVTNNHVIEDSNSLKVTFIDESMADAAVKGTDSASDLAVIAIPLDSISADTKSKIKTATLGDSDAMKMGQGVIAIGNALGLGQSVTVGHVSAVNREITVDGQKKTVIQTDAAINPGNSGGALLNAKGEVIGINEAKYADTNVEGVGYAIPISNAKEIIEDLKERSTKIEVAEEHQGYLGIQVQNIDESMSKIYGMPEGVYVYKIMEDSAAAGSDLREKDIITRFDGETVRNNADLTRLLTYYKSGTTVNLTVQSLENGEYVERAVSVTLKTRPQEQEEVRQK